MEPKIRTRLTNLIARLAGSPDYDPRVKPKFPIEFYLEKYIKEPIPKISLPENFLDGEQHTLSITKNTIDRIKTIGLVQVYLEEHKTTYTCVAYFSERDEGLGLSFNVMEDVSDFPAAGATSIVIRIIYLNGKSTIVGTMTEV